MAGSRILDGSSFYSESAAGTDYNGLSGFTIAAWVYRSATGQYTYPWGISNGSSNVIALYWWGGDNCIYMDVRNGTSAKYRATSANTSTGWVFLTGVFDGTAADASRMQVYVNGASQSTSGTTSNPSTTSASLGTVYGSVGRIATFSPAIASNGHAYAYVSLYNVALTAREIAELYINPTAVQRGRVHCWALNGNESTATHTEADLQRVHALTGNSMTSTSASMLSPKITIGASPTWL